MRLSSQWENGYWSLRNVFRISCVVASQKQSHLTYQSPIEMAFVQQKKRKRAKLRRFLPQSSKYGQSPIFALFRAFSRHFRQTPSRCSTMYRKLYVPLPMSVKGTAMGPPKSYSLLSCGTCSSAPQLVPLSRRRVRMALCCAVHRLPELDTLFDKEPLWRPRQRKDMKKANTRHALAW
jgi:hypothetical protein